MAACRACGAAVGREFRFCPQCAAPVGTEIDLIDYGVPLRTEVEVHRGGPGLRWALALGGLLLVVLVVTLWLVGRLTGGTPPPSGDAAPPSTRPAADGLPATGGSPGAGTAPLGGPGPSDPQPVLGRPTGLVLLVGSPVSLESVDLDTGAVTTYRRGGRPLLASGGRLVTRRSDDSVWSVPLADPDGAGGVKLGETLRPGAAPGPTPGQAWVLLGDEPAWHLVDLTNGTGTEVRPAGDPLDDLLMSSRGPAVERSPSGGVWALEGDSYRKVSDARLLAVSDGFALAETCDQPARCRWIWLDRATWAPAAQRPVPADPWSGPTGAWLSPDGRFLAYATLRGPVRVFDVARNAEVQIASPDSGSLSASPDGTVLSLLNGGAPQVYDTTNGRTAGAGVNTASLVPGGATTLLVSRP